MKLRALVPCDVSDAATGYKARVVEAVFDPLRVAEVNGRFRAAGFAWDDDDEGGGMRVIAVTDDGSILLWGGLNSVYHLRRGERLVDDCFRRDLGGDDMAVAVPGGRRHAQALLAGGRPNHPAAGVRGREGLQERYPDV